MPGAIYAGLAFLLGMALRLLPRMLVPTILSQDAYFHLAMIRTVRSQGWRAARRQMVGYPLGFHVILSRMPRRLLRVFERVNGIVWDLLQTALFVATVRYVGSATTSVNVILGALLIFIAPAWLYVGLGPRAHHLTERVFGELAVSVVMCALWFYSTSGNAWWIGGALVAGAILLNASKFSAQVLFLFCAVLVLVRRDPVFVIVPLGAVALGVLLSGGTYWVILREQARHLAWYRIAVREGTVPVAHRNSLVRAYQLWREGGSNAAGRYILLHHSLIIGVLQHPALVIVAAWALRYGTMAVPSYPMQWLLAAILCWIATSARFGLFLGEAERYLIHAVIPEYFLFVMFVLPVWPAAGWCLLAYSVLWLFAQVYLLKRLESAEDLREPARRELVAFLRTLRRMRFATFGAGVMWDLAYETDHEHFLLSSSKHIDWKDLFSTYPFTRWAGMATQECELLVLEHAGVERARVAGVVLDYPIASSVLLFENVGYMVYRLPASQTC